MVGGVTITEGCIWGHHVRGQTQVSYGRLFQTKAKARQVQGQGWTCLKPSQVQYMLQLTALPKCHCRLQRILPERK